jgi:hypothetical protein
VLDRYAEELQAHESKLMLAGVSDFSKGVIEVTGEIDTYGRENIFVATEEVGGSIRDAYHAAEQWVAQHREHEAIEEAIETEEGEEADG